MIRQAVEELTTMYGQLPPERQKNAMANMRRFLYWTKLQKRTGHLAEAVRRMTENGTGTA